MLTSAMATAAHHLTTREALSGIWGSISLCAWIFLLVSAMTTDPQLGPSGYALYSACPTDEFV
jgi:hypothetical protein